MKIREYVAFPHLWREHEKENHLFHRESARSTYSRKAISLIYAN